MLNTAYFCEAIRKIIFHQGDKLLFFRFYNFEEKNTNRADIECFNEDNLPMIKNKDEQKLKETKQKMNASCCYFHCSRSFAVT